MLRPNVSGFFACTCTIYMYVEQESYIFIIIQGIPRATLIKGLCFRAKQTYKITDSYTKTLRIHKNKRSSAGRQHFILTF